MKKHDKNDNRKFVYRRIGAVIGTVAIIGGSILGLSKCKGCERKVNIDETIPTNTFEETISTGDNLGPILADREETEPINAEEYDISINTDGTLPTNRNGGSYNGGSYNGGNGTSATSTNTNGTPSSTTPTPYIPYIPGVDSSNVTVYYDPSGRPQTITWPTAETTVIAPIIDTDPHGTDPLPVEPSHVVNPDTTPDTPPTSAPTTAPTSGPTPAIPTGDVPGEQPTVYPTEPSVPVPTDASEPSAPTAAPTDPTSAPTLPDIPTWDLPDQEEVVYTFNGMAISRALKLTR